jgi:serine protease Do
LEKYRKLVVLALALTLLPACTPDYDERYHPVTAVTDNGALLLRDGVKVELTGLEPTEGSRAWLRKHVAGQRVRVVYDSRQYPESTEPGANVLAYVLTEDGASVNGYLAGAQLAPVVAGTAFDSAAAFRAYAAGQRVVEPGTAPAVAADTNEAEEAEPADEPLAATAPGDLSDLVDRLEPAVFLIQTNGGSLGTGFFVSAGGLAVSNYHVFRGSDAGYVKLTDGRQRRITEIVDANEEADYIVFRVAKGENSPNEAYPYLRLAPTVPRRASEVLVIGNPEGLERTFTKGVVSALRGENQELIQFDAAISSGSSGSPVMNARGQVVGIATFKRLDCENCNFAVNIRRVGLGRFL